MGIVGIGVDIIEISRFKRLASRKNSIFLKKIFTQKELKYCFAKKNPAGSLAARFAAKEAVIKATSRFMAISMNEIEIVNNKNNAPIAIIHNKKMKANISVSMSHSKDHAIAFAICHDEH